MAHILDGNFLHGGGAQRYTLQGQTIHNMAKDRELQTDKKTE